MTAAYAELFHATAAKFGADAEAQRKRDERFLRARSDIADLLTDALDYLREDYDIRDSEHGPRPNRAMELGQRIEEIMEAIK